MQTKFDQDLDNLLKEIKKSQQEIQEKSKVILHKAFKDFFLIYGDVVECIFWAQFSPFFNDGEACEFSVQDIYLNLMGAEENGDGEGSTLYSKEDLDEAKKHLKLYVEWEADKEAALIKYETHYTKKHGTSPFHNRPNDRNNWKPYYRYNSSIQVQNKIEEIENFVKTYPNLTEDFKSIKRFINAIEEKTMEDMFGNHVKVIVSKTGIEVEEYSHD